MVPVIFQIDRERAYAEREGTPVSPAIIHREAEREAAAGDRLHLGNRGLRRLLHPQELRQLDRAERRAGGSPLRLPPVLRPLHRGHLDGVRRARRGVEVLMQTAARVIPGAPYGGSES